MHISNSNTFVSIAEFLRMCESNHMKFYSFHSQRNAIALWDINKKNEITKISYCVKSTENFVGMAQFL